MEGCARGGRVGSEEGGQGGYGGGGAGAGAREKICERVREEMRCEERRTWGGEVHGKRVPGGGEDVFELESEEREASCFDNGTRLFSAIRILKKNIQ